MKKFDSTKVQLPKWPAFIVVGKPVPRQYAQEILIRTDRIYLSTNDHDFQLAAYRVLGIELDSDTSYLHPNWESVQKVRAELHCIESLEYLHNERICSSWIGGPHGWLDWSGSVGCNNSNIGKYPSPDGVLAEWQAIAKAFPYLDLTCQLYDKEVCEEGGVPVIEYRVKSGKARALVPKEPIDAPTDLSIMAALLSPTGERGCTVEQLQDAVTHTRLVTAGFR